VGRDTVDRDTIGARAADAGLALLLCLIGVVGTTGAGRMTGSDVDGLAYALVLVAALSLAVRRVWPSATLAVVAACAFTYLVLGYPYGPIFLMVLVATYTVARYVPLRRAATASVAALAVLLAHVFVPGSPGLLGIVPGSAWVVVPFALGVTVRLNREAAERARAEMVRRHADDERLRVAQEVHDVVGHGLAAITMQAEIALHLLPKRPEQAEAALSAISRTSREALDELRTTLTVLRRTDARDDRAPTAGLARLDDLVARMSDTGVPVRVETIGQAHDLPAAVDLAAYRVVQESLTNVLRHAGAATAMVRLTYMPGELSVEVSDTGGGVDGFAEGLGIAGMRERVSALGGAFAAGPIAGASAGGGFRVHASLPLGTP
jgi:signal transduction histidine kinase